MRNRRKTLLRDHVVLDVTLKACLKHYQVSAIPETLTIHRHKRPPINGGESDLRDICSTGRQQVFQFNLFHSSSVKLWEYSEYPHIRSISKQILTGGYLSIKLCTEDQKDLQLPRFSTQSYQVAVTETNCLDHPPSQICQKVILGHY